MTNHEAQVLQIHFRLDAIISLLRGAIGCVPLFYDAQIKACKPWSVQGLKCITERDLLA